MGLLNSVRPGTCRAPLLLAIILVLVALSYPIFVTAKESSNQVCVSPDELSRAQAELAQSQKTLSTEAAAHSAIKADLAAKTEELANANKQAKADAQALQERLNKAKDDLSAAEAKVSALSTQAENLVKEAEEGKQALSKQNEVLRAQLEEQTKKIVALQEKAKAAAASVPESATNELKSLQEKISSLEGKHADQAQNIEESKEVIGSLEKENAKLKKSVELLEKEISASKEEHKKSLKSSLDDLQRELRSLKRDLKSSKQELQEAQLSLNVGPWFERHSATASKYLSALFDKSVEHGKYALLEAKRFTTKTQKSAEHLYESAVKPSVAPALVQVQKAWAKFYKDNLAQHADPVIKQAQTHSAPYVAQGKAVYDKYAGEVTGRAKHGYGVAKKIFLKYRRRITQKLESFPLTKKYARYIVDGTAGLIGAVLAINIALIFLKAVFYIIRSILYYSFCCCCFARKDQGERRPSSGSASVTSKGSASSAAPPKKRKSVKKDKEKSN